MLFSWSVNMAFGTIFEAKQGYRAAFVAIGSQNQMGTLSGISVWVYEWGHVLLAEQSTAVTPCTLLQRSGCFFLLPLASHSVTHPCLQHIAPTHTQKAVEAQATSAGLLLLWCASALLSGQGSSSWDSGSLRVCVQYLRKYKLLYSPQLVGWKLYSCFYMVKGKFKL